MKKLLILFVVLISISLVASELQASDVKALNIDPAAEQEFSMVRLARNGKSKDCNLISSSEAIKKAQRKAKGKVVGVKLKRAGKSSVYRVRVLVDKKRIKNINIKACK